MKQRHICRSLTPDVTGGRFSMSGLERATVDDKFYDYCHKEYTPRVPFAGKLQSSSLLFHFLQYLQCGGEHYDVVDIIRTQAGTKGTVWGIKRDSNNRFGIEFYLYNKSWAQEERVHVVSSMLKALAPYCANSFPTNESLPYSMFSIDMDPTGRCKPITGVNLYVGAYSYDLGSTGLSLGNRYDFYEPRKQRKQLFADIFKTAFVDRFGSQDLEPLMLDFCLDCRAVCRAHKRNLDALYFSGIDCSQFLKFLRLNGYPGPIVDFVNDRYLELDHLRYDVGIDYGMKDEKLTVMKSGYYGIM